jgi:hypothetical protein
MPFGTKIEYRGYTLKSKVEWEWARLFDEHGLTWEYEPIAFRDPGAPHGKGYTYTPDFGLNGRTFFVETKPYSTKHLNRFHLCPAPLYLIFGYPDRHYIRFKPAGKAGFEPGHYNAWWKAFRV